MRKQIFNKFNVIVNVSWYFLSLDLCPSNLLGDFSRLETIDVLELTFRYYVAKRDENVRRIFFRKQR